MTIKARRLAPVFAAALWMVVPSSAHAEPEVVVSAGGGRGGPAEYQLCIDAGCEDIETKRSGLFGVGVAETVGHFRASLRFDSTLGGGDTIGATSGVVTSLGFSAGRVFVELGLGLGVNWMSDTIARDSLVMAPSIHSAIGVRVTDSLAFVSRLDGLAGAPLALLSLEWTIWRPTPPAPNEPDMIAGNF